MDLLRKTRSLYECFGDWLDGERSLLGESPESAAIFESRDDVENLGRRIPMGRASGVARLDSIFTA
ncbi:MAG: hypothetical protein NDI61_10820, partial [Bdellovibrionaceae bacterium]|nr:hypothetical protein [Pseudobdellovibrionaceae bacterium]